MKPRDRVGLGRDSWECRPPRRLRRRCAAVADPDREHRLRPDTIGCDARCTTPTTDVRGVGRRGERGRHVHHQDGVVVADRRAAPRAPRRSAPRRRRRRCRPDWRCDQIGGSAASSVCIVSGEMPASVPPRSTSRSTASTPMPPPLVRIASRLPANGSHAAERLRRGEQLVEIEHAQQAGAAERGVVDRVRAGERAGVGLRRLGALRMAAGLDHDHRLDRARRRAPPT